jgi:hypothetical protein
MPERTIKSRLQNCDAAIASDDGPIFSTVAKLVVALKRSIPEGTQNAELKQEALCLAREVDEHLAQQFARHCCLPLQWQPPRG